MDPPDADDEKLNENTERDPRLFAIPDTHGHAKGEHKSFAEERPLPLTARMLFLWFYHACRRGYPRFLMVADHMNYLTFEDPAAVNLVRRALKLAQAGDLYGAAETASVEVPHAAVVSEGLRRGMRYSIGAEVDNDPRSRPDAQNIVDAMRPDAIIRSVHFLTVTHPAHGDNWHWPFDNPEFKEMFEVVGVEQTWELYLTTLIDAIERLPGHIVGHFFVPAVFGHWPDDAKLDEYENRMLGAAAARNMAVEFNTRFLYRDHSDEEKARYLEANKRLLRKARDRGIGIAVGSDAHSPRDQGGAFETVLAVLDELEINEIVFPLAGSLRRVALRVVREPEPEPVVPERSAADDAAASDVAAPAAKPVRKARPRPKATRPAESSPERRTERPEISSAPTEPPPAETKRSAEPAEPVTATEAARPEPSRDAAADAAPVPAATKAPAPKPAAKKVDVAAKPEAGQPPVKPVAAKPVAAKPAAAKPVAAKPVAAKQGAAKPVAAVAPKPSAAKPVAAPTKTLAAKPTVAKPAAGKPVAAKTESRPTAKPAVAKGATAKAPGRPAARPGKAAAAKAAGKPVASKKAAPVKATAKKAPAKAASARKPAPKKAVPAKKSPPRSAATKKAAPAKKGPAKKATAAKKTTPARSAPARKTSAVKKTTKKTATKRR